MKKLPLFILLFSFFACASSLLAENNDDWFEELFESPEVKNKKLKVVKPIESAKASPKKSRVKKVESEVAEKKAPKKETAPEAKVEESEIANLKSAPESAEKAPVVKRVKSEVVEKKSTKKKSWVGSFFGRKKKAPKGETAPEVKVGESETANLKSAPESTEKAPVVKKIKSEVVEKKPTKKKSWLGSFFTKKKKSSKNEEISVAKKGESKQGKKKPWLSQFFKKKKKLVRNESGKKLFLDRMKAPPLLGNQEVKGAERNKKIIGKKTWIKKVFKKTGGVVSSSVEYDLNFRDHFGLVTHTHVNYESIPFPHIGKYTLDTSGDIYDTGLSYPFYPGDFLKTHEHRISLRLRKPTFVTVDKGTSIGLDSILGITEIALSKGRLRIKVLKGGQPCTVLTREVNVYVHAGDDVIVDAAGSVITRLYVLEGGLSYTASEGKGTVYLKKGLSISLGESEAKSRPMEENEISYLAKILDFGIPEPSKYGSSVESARSFYHDEVTDWPIKKPVYSGILCPHCSHAFNLKDQARNHCPYCQKELYHVTKLSSCSVCELSYATPPRVCLKCGGEVSPKSPYRCSACRKVIEEKDRLDKKCSHCDAPIKAFKPVSVRPEKSLSL